MALRRDRELIAGDTFICEGTATGIASGLLRCTVKRYRDDGDIAAVAECDTNDGGIDVVGDAFTVTFGPDETEDWPIGHLSYDIQLVTDDEEVCTLVRGSLSTRRRVTRARTMPSSHAPLLAGRGDLVLTGADAEFTWARGIAADAGALALTGADIEFRRDLVLSAEAGALTLAGDASIAAQRRLAADAGALVLTGADATLTYAVNLASIITALGSRLHYWFEVGVSTETLNSGNFSQINDVGPGAYHASQGTPGNQPSKVVGGGPNGKNCITYQGTTRHLVNTSVGLTANRSLMFFDVAAVVLAGATRIAFCTRDGNAAGLGSVNNAAASSATNTYLKIIRHNGGSEQQISVTSPAANTGWHVWTQRYASGAAAVTQIDTTVTTPAPTGTGNCTALDAIVFGHPTVAAGSSYLHACVENCTADEEAMIRSYIRFQTGLAS